MSVEPNVRLDPNEEVELDGELDLEEEVRNTVELDTEEEELEENPEIHSAE